MKQIIVTAERQAEIIERPAQSIPENGIRLKTQLSGVSVGTEMAVYRGTIPNLRTGRWGYWNEFPIYPGYELVGRVSELGQGTKDINIGDRVVALEAHGTEAVTTPDRYVPIPDSVSDEDATLAILGATTLHGIRRANVVYGDRVLVLGLGVVGILAAFHAQRAGVASLIVADPQPARRELARSLGFLQVEDSMDPDFAKKIGPQDVVIEAAGVQGAFQTGLKCLDQYGRLLVQGTHTSPVSLDLCDFTMHRQTTIISTWAIGSGIQARRPGGKCEARENLELSMELIRRGELPVQSLITHRRKFNELPSLYKELDQGIPDSLQIILTDY